MFIHKSWALVVRDGACMRCPDRCKRCKRVVSEPDAPLPPGRSTRATPQLRWPPCSSSPRRSKNESHAGVGVAAIGFGSQPVKWASEVVANRAPHVGRDEWMRCSASSRPAGRGAERWRPRHFEAPTSGAGASAEDRHSKPGAHCCATCAEAAEGLAAPQRGQRRNKGSSNLAATGNRGRISMSGGEGVLRMNCRIQRGESAVLYKRAR